MKTRLKGLILATGLAGSVFAAEKPNVVLIVCDDLNDYITGIPGQTGHPQTITPNIEKLAKSGVAFRRAYSNHPVCAPSRSSFLTGIYGHTSGNLFWSKWFENPVLKNSRSLMDYFKQNGYHVAGSGKLMHHGKPNEWSEFKHKADYGPMVYDGENGSRIHACRNRSGISDPLMGHGAHSKTSPMRMTAIRSPAGSTVNGARSSR